MDAHKQHTNHITPLLLLFPPPSTFCSVYFSPCTQIAFFTLPLPSPSSTLDCVQEEVIEQVNNTPISCVHDSHNSTLTLIIYTPHSHTPLNTSPSSLTFTAPRHSTPLTCTCLTPTGEDADCSPCSSLFSFTSCCRRRYSSGSIGICHSNLSLSNTCIYTYGKQR